MFGYRNEGVTLVKLGFKIQGNVCKFPPSEGSCKLPALRDPNTTHSLFSLFAILTLFILFYTLSLPPIPKSV